MTPSLKPLPLISLALILMMLAAGCAQTVPYAPCSYDACCQKSADAKEFFCDHEGCSCTLPNWTPPICGLETTMSENKSLVNIDGGNWIPPSGITDINYVFIGGGPI